MLKYQQIIKNLSNEEKIKLIVSNHALRNGSVANYNLPIINVDTNLKSCDRKNKFTSYESLAYTWNLEAIRKVGYVIGKANLHEKSDKALGLDTSLGFTQDKYLRGRMINSCLEGMNKANAFSTVVNNTTYNCSYESEVRKEFLSFDLVMSNKENQPSAVYVSTLHDVDYLHNEIEYKGLIMCEVKTPSELVKALNKKCHVVIYQGDANEVILPLLRKHQDKTESLEYGEISKEVFDDLRKSGVILQPSVLDEIIDELLDHLASFDDKICSNEINVVPTTVYEDVANESVVLLHNNGLLPISPNTSVYLLGKRFFELDANLCDIKPVDYFQNYSINVVGASKGYEKGLSTNEAVIKNAIGNAEVANTTIIYMKQDLASGEFLEEEVQLLKDLTQTNRRVVAVVEAKRAFDFELFKECAAILYVEEAYNGFMHAVVNIITGAVNPSGRLPKYLPKNKDTEVNPLDSSSYLFPLGYGLSYSNVKYSNLKVYNLGITFTLKNDSKYITSEVPQFYVSIYDKDNNLISKELKGFKKVTLLPNECVSVTIPFDKFTFSSYNDEYDCYEIKGGSYHLTVANNALSEGLNAEVKLGHKLYNGLNEGLEIQIIDNDSFNKELLKEEAANKGLSFKKKMILTISSMVYFDITFLIILCINLLFQKYGTVVLILLILGGFNTLLGLYIKKIVKHNRLYGEKYVKPVDSLNTMLQGMEDFKEVAKVTYYEPVKEEVVEEAQPALEEAQPTLEEVKVEDAVVVEEVKEEVPTKVYTGDDYNTKYTSDIVFDTEISFEDYVKLFSNYVSSKGIIIEPKSARVLLSSLFSTRFLILRSSSKELLPKFKELLSTFFDSVNNSIDMSGVNEFNDLIWKLEDEKYVRTDFVKFLYRTKSLKRHFSICSLDNVDVKNIANQLGGIYKYIVNPNEHYQINIGNETMVEEYTLPKNLYFIATTNDDEYLENINDDLAQHSLSVELMLRENEIPAVEEVNIKYISTTRMSLMLKEFKENQYLSEKEWKKIDDLEEAINDMAKFRIENKSVLDFEKMIGLMLNCDASLDEIYDTILASRIVPTLKSHPVYLTKNGDKTLYTMMEKIFGEDTLPMTKRAMIKNN